LAALDTFDGRRVALIVGGQDRGIDYAPLANALQRRSVPTYVLTLPDSGPRISAEIQALTGNSGSLPDLGLAVVTDCLDLDAAVVEGFRWARPDGVVLLSPAAPSFGRFRDYVERGEAFARAMRTLA
jgi:UDP-N-acetylmuramoylalanine--D-glutamate ligase